MYRTISLVTIAVLSIVFPLIAQTSQAKPDLKQELIALDHQLAAAEQKHDLGVLKRLLADDFVSTDQRGKVRNRTQVLEHFRTEGAMPEHSPSTGDYEVRIAGNTAVMTHSTTFASADGGSQEIRATHVWAKRGGRWQMISDACTAVVTNQPIVPDLPALNAACSVVSFEPEVQQFYGDAAVVVRNLDRADMQLSRRRAYMLLVESDQAAELTFFERSEDGRMMRVARWQGSSAGDLRDQLSAMMLANKGIACIGRQTKAYVEARYRPQDLGDIPSPVSSSAAFAHLVRHFESSYLRVTVFLLC